MLRQVCLPAGPGVVEYPIQRLAPTLLTLHLVRPPSILPVAERPLSTRRRIPFSRSPRSCRIGRRCFARALRRPS